MEKRGWGWELFVTECCKLQKDEGEGSAVILFDFYIYVPISY